MGAEHRSAAPICLFGSYEDTHAYSRTAILRSSLRRLGFEVVERRPRKSRPSDRVGGLSQFSAFVRLAWATARNCASLLRHAGALRRHPLILVPYPAHLDVVLARLMTVGSRATIVMDAFLLLHDTVVHDRRLIREGSVIAKAVERWERIALHLADHVLIDSETQRTRLCEQFGLDEDAVTALPVGIDEGIWTPAPMPSFAGRFRVAFWGTFIPLHGVETIVDAAAVLRSRGSNVDFTIVGDGQTAPEIATRIEDLDLPNLTWRRGLESAESIRRLAEDAHCVLGIFGDSSKADSVIPYKLYQAFATSRPVITRSSTAVREEIPDGDAVVTVPARDGNALADAIEALASDPDRCLDLAERARAVYDSRMSNEVFRSRLGAALAPEAR